jgi:RNA polymerase sigma factor (sigma-70 family)
MCTSPRINGFGPRGGPCAAADGGVNKTHAPVVVRRVSGPKRDRLLGEIEAVYRRRYPSFLRVAAAITRDEDAGRDAVQDGFARAVRGRHGYKGRGTLEAWLWKAVVNAARDRRRSGSDVPLAEEPEEARSDEPGQLRAAIAALHERQRLAIFLRYFADLDQRSIAKVLGVRPGTVAATLHAARESLRATLKEVEAWQR